MFLGTTDLIIGDYYTGRNVGTISTIKKADNKYIFTMYNGDIYKATIDIIDILTGAGDRIFIDESKIAKGA